MYTLLTTSTFVVKFVKVFFVSINDSPITGQQIFSFSKKDYLGVLPI